MALRQVLYGSSAVSPMNQAEIDVILSQARRRNAETGITGALFYLDGNFLQLLEGEDPALAETYQRIKSDSRHRGLVQLLSGTITERTFAGENMAYRGITATELAENEELFVFVNGRWTLRDDVGVDLTLKILIETFLRVNDGRGY